MPITLSCICSSFEKQIVFRFRRLRWVLKLRFLRSIFQVSDFPTACFSDGMYFLTALPVVSIVTSYRESRKFIHQAAAALVCSSAMHAMPALRRFFFQLRTMSISDSFYFRHALQNSSASASAWISISSSQGDIWLRCAMKYGFTSAGLFFRSSEMTVSFEILRFLLHVSDSAAVQSLFLNLFLACKASMRYRYIHVESFFRIFCSDNVGLPFHFDRF